MSPNDPIPVRLYTVHHARFLALNLFGGCAVFAPPSGHEPVLMGLGLALLAMALLTRESDWGAQPLTATEQGLQVGTLYRNLKGSELRAWTSVGTRSAHLHGDFVTLEMHVDASNEVALQSVLHVALTPLQQGKPNILMPGALGYVLLFAAVAALSVSVLTLGPVGGLRIASPTFYGAAIALHGALLLRAKWRKRRL